MSSSLKRQFAAKLWIRRIGGKAFLTDGRWTLRCAIGRTGATRDKREGDGATPCGAYRVLYWMIRTDARPLRPHGAARPIRADEGWCDEARAQVYNRKVKLPCTLSHEILRRPDFKYNVVGVLDWNIRPRSLGRGSAIFFHFCDENFGATAGCIAVRPRDWPKIAARIGPNTKIIV